MQNSFNTLIDGYIENKIGIAEDFLSAPLALHLKDNLMRLFAQNRLLPAGTGKNQTLEHDSAVRSDRIHWLDRAHEDQYENSFFDLMDLFVEHLNSTCFAGIHSYEFHYALYEKGSFYKTHVDRFRNNDSRQFSMIMYLNEDWEKADGGELCIHLDDRLQNISPSNGKSVFFKSDELRHEVLMTNKPRMSITGWLKS